MILISILADNIGYVQAKISHQWEIVMISILLRNRNIFIRDGASFCDIHIKKIDKLINIITTFSKHRVDLGGHSLLATKIWAFHEILPCNLNFGYFRDKMRYQLWVVDFWEWLVLHTRSKSGGWRVCSAKLPNLCSPTSSFIHRLPPKELPKIIVLKILMSKRIYFRYLASGNV